MNNNERIANQVFEMISECFSVPMAEISRDYQIGVRVENVRSLGLDDAIKIPGLLETVEFAMRLDEAIPENVIRTPAQKRSDRLFHKRLATGQITAGQLIDWMIEYSESAPGVSD